LKWLELRVPPPAVMAVVGLLMWVAARAFPQADFQLPARGPLASAIALIGLAIAIVAVFKFRRAGTTPNPMKPRESVTVVVSGVYRYSRNPMYVGDLLILAGWGFGSPTRRRFSACRSSSRISTGSRSLPKSARFRHASAPPMTRTAPRCGAGSS